MAESVKKVLAKVILLGDMGVGKTTLLNGYCKSEGKASASMGPDFRKKDIRIDNVEVNMQIWDTAGQEQFSALGGSYFRGADCCLIVYDITNKASFDNLSKWRTQLIQGANVSDPNTFPIVIVGNKNDLVNRAVEEAEARAWCASNGNLQYFETSGI